MQIGTVSRSNFPNSFIDSYMTAVLTINTLCCMVLVFSLHYRGKNWKYKHFKHNDKMTLMIECIGSSIESIAWACRIWACSCGRFAVYLAKSHSTAKASNFIRQKEICKKKLLSVLSHINARPQNKLFLNNYIIRGLITYFVVNLLALSYTNSRIHWIWINEKKKSFIFAYNQYPYMAI